MEKWKLEWTQQPIDVGFGKVIHPYPRVDVKPNIEDSKERIIDGVVSVKIQSGPEGAVLQGTTSVNCPGGVAVFDDLIPSLPGEYVLRAECDEDSLEVVARPSSYRYTGAFPVELGQEVDITTQSASTTGIVTEVGAEYIVVVDNSSFFQQTLVAGVDWVQVAGTDAVTWVAADAPGMDPAGSLGFWEVSGFQVTEVADRFAPMTIKPVPANVPRLIPSPIGFNKGLTASPDTGSGAHAYVLGEDMPVRNAANTTYMFLATYPYEKRGPANGGLFHNIGALQAAGRTSIGGSSGQSGVAVRVGGQWAYTLDYHIRDGHNKWHLVGIYRRARAGNLHWVDIYVDGILAGSGFYSYNGSAGDIQFIESVISHGGSISQIGIWAGDMGQEWHLEQARRCGLSP